MKPTTTPLRIPLAMGGSISGVLLQPEQPRFGLVLAHGAGAGMNHPFMTDLSAALCRQGVATLRYQFPYMEEGGKRPDSPAIAHMAVRAAVAEGGGRLPELPLFAGGKSFGGRMTSQAQAERALDRVRGLVFVGFPLHPAGKPATDRAVHLERVDVPMLFLQGTRDALADLELMKGAAGRLGSLATLHVVDAADHAFHVLARSGRRDPDVIEELAERTAAWMAVQGAVANDEPA